MEECGLRCQSWPLADYLKDPLDQLLCASCLAWRKRVSMQPRRYWKLHKNTQRRNGAIQVTESRWRLNNEHVGGAFLPITSLCWELPACRSKPVWSPDADLRCRPRIPSAVPRPVDVPMHTGRT